MENNNQNPGKHGMTCNCMSCQWSDMKAHHMGYRIARKIFVVFLVLVAFWFGTKYGETKAIQYQIRGEQRIMMQEQAANQAGYAPTGAAAQ